MTRKPLKVASIVLSTTVVALVPAALSTCLEIQRGSGLARDPFQQADRFPPARNVLMKATRPMFPTCRPQARNAFMANGTSCAIGSAPSKGSEAARISPNTRARAQSNELLTSDGRGWSQSVPELTWWWRLHSPLGTRC